MACKNSHPPERCGDCEHIDRETYRGAGQEVCYELQYIGDRKVAVQISERRKACNKFHNAKKVGRAG